MVFHFQLDADVCQSLGLNLCETYKKTQVALRPSKQSGLVYSNVTTIVNRVLLDMINGNYDLVEGLDEMDAELSKILGNPPKNGAVIVNPPITVPGTRKQLKHLDVQIISLIVVMATVIGGIYAYHKRQDVVEQIELQNRKEKGEETSLIPKVKSSKYYGTDLEKTPLVK